MNDHSEKDEAETRPGGNLPMPTCSASGEVRANLSLQHLRAAAMFSRQVGQLEVANAGKPFGAFFDELTGASAACVIMAFAGAEAYINEVFVDRKRHFPGQDPVALTLLWQELEEESIKKKYDSAHRLAGAGCIEWGVAPNQGFDLLRKLRNALTHFTPEWPSEAVAHERLSNQLVSVATASAWRSNEPLFPSAWVSHGSTVWAVSAATEFIRGFCASSGIENRLAKHSALIDP